MRICVFGAGAVGGYLAGRLARGGREVSLIARGAHLHAIKADGLTIETPDERFTVHPPATDRPAELGRQDLVIITAKTPAFPAIAKALAPLLGPETAVAFAVNGVFWFYAHGFALETGTPDTRRLDPDGALHRLVGPERAVGMVVYSPNEVVSPGVVRNGRHDDNRFVIGEPAPGTQPAGRVDRLVAGLSGCGFIVEPAADLRHAMWQKLVRNVSGSPLCTLTGADGRAAFDDPSIRQIGKRLLVETLAVAAAHGFDELGIDPEAASAARSHRAHKPSMLQDLERGRPMEIDSMLAIVQDFARQAAVPTPTLDIILALLTARARSAGCYPPATPIAG